MFVFKHKLCEPMDEQLRIFTCEMFVFLSDEFKCYEGILGVA